MKERDDVVNCFDEIGLRLKNEVVDKCVEVCSSYNIDATELVETWMAFSVMNALDSVPTMESIGEMEKKDLSKRTRSSVKTPKQVESVKIYNAVTPRNDDDVLNIYSSAQKEGAASSIATTPRTPRFRQGTPSQLKTPRLLFSPASYSSESIAGSQKYADRGKSGTVVRNFGNSSLTNWQSSAQWSAKIMPVDESPLLPNDVDYMFEKVWQKAAAVCEQTTYITDKLVEKFNLDAPTCLSELTLEPVTYVGRICSDNDYKLNASSILLEDSAHGNVNGECVELDVADVPNYSLFPGQMVAFKGKNTTTKKIFAADCIYTDASPPSAPYPTDITNLSGPLQIVISVGPYTPSDTLSYEPIEDLFRYVREHKPHILIIVGPIVDATHPLIVEGKLAETFAACYDRILKQIVQPLSKTHTKVIVVSSWREAAYHVIYPTPPSYTSLPSHYPNLVVLPDPSIISINGLYVGLTSTDILMHLGKEEIFHYSDTEIRPDRLSRLASYIIQQRHFYPLVPPDDEMSLDYHLWLKYGRLNIIPHLLILPSDLHYFMKIIHGCLVINPERLTKVNIGGTFARIEVLPPAPGETWSVESHINAEILKI